MRHHFSTLVFIGHGQHATPNGSTQGVSPSCLASIHDHKVPTRLRAVVVRPLLPLAVFAGLHLNQGADGGPSAQPRGPD